MRLSKHRLFVLYACLAGGTALVCGIAAGCGDDSSVAPADAGADATADTNAAPDGWTDSGSAPTGDGPWGIVDAGDVAVNVPALSAFPHAVDVAYCSRLQQCCLVPPNRWNQNGVNGCVPTLDSNGGVVGLAGFNAALDSGLVVYDKSAAKTCLDGVYSFTCGVAPSTAVGFVRDLCFGAMKGTLAAGSGPCVNSLECADGLYCHRTPDGGPETCAPLEARGQVCADTTNSTDCSYLGNGTPALYCAGPSDGGTPTCQPALPDDAGCNQRAACQSWACNYPTCVESFVFSDPGTPSGTCAAFTLIDGGRD